MGATPSTGMKQFMDTLDDARLADNKRAQDGRPHLHVEAMAVALKRLGVVVRSSDIRAQIPVEEATERTIRANIKQIYDNAIRLEDGRRVMRHKNGEFWVIHLPGEGTDYKLTGPPWKKQSSSISAEPRA